MPNKTEIRCFKRWLWLNDKNDTDDVDAFKESSAQE